MALVRPWQRPTTDSSLANHEGRLRSLERRPPGTWVYAGTYPTDPDTTPDSEPFQNGVTNALLGQQRLRYRRTNENQLEVEGVVNIPPATGPVVILTFTDPIYIPGEDIPGPGIVNGVPCEWVLQSNGDLVFNGETCCDDGGGIDWGENTDPGVGLSLKLAPGQPFTLLDSDGNPMLQMTEGSPDLHLPTGGDVILDL